MSVNVNKQGFLQSNEIASFLKIDKLGFLGQAISKGIMRATKLDELNNAYAQRANLSAIAFIDSMFDYLGIDYKVYEKDLARIPKTGPFITVSNHPLGGIDGMILLRLLLERRPDFKVMGNFLLERVSPLKPHIVSVNPFEDYKNVRSSYMGLKAALKQLREGKPLGIFPAGEVSTLREGEITDREWMPEAMRFIQKAKVPIVPIYFHARNSDRFYAWSSMSGLLRTVMLPAEMTSQHQREITVRIGKAIPPFSLENYGSTAQFSAYLRKKTYLLSRSLSTEKEEEKQTQQSEILAPVAKELLEQEANWCRDNGKRLFSFKQYELFVAQQAEVPNVVTEIGRQREIVFRAVGEGSNNAIDLDNYDTYYHHLFIYDKEEKALVGAYRMGIGREIYKEKGLDGFYLNELFCFDEERFAPILENGIELGRAFVAKAYQRKPMSLFLLWKGILMMLIKEDLKYLLGGVSISDRYSAFSKSVIIDFMQSHYFDTDLAQYVKARQPFKVNLAAEEKELLAKCTDNDLQKLDSLIDELEPHTGMKLPVLLKKYVKQNTKLIGFNIDPKFNDALDGLMYVCIDEIPEKTLGAAIEEYQRYMQGEES